MEGQTIPLDVQTSAAGATFVPLAALKTYTCSRVTVHNNTGTTLEVKRDDNAAGLVPIYDKDRYSFWINDPGRLGIRRADQSNTQVTAKVEVQSF